MAETIKVSFEVQIPTVEHTEEELEEWLRFCFKDNGRLPKKNPLSNHCPYPVLGTFECNG